MTRLFWKSTFVASVVVLSLILLVPVQVGYETLFGAKRGPDGRYRSGDTSGLFIVIWAVILWLADRVVAALFRRALVSGNRWSLFRSPRSWAWPEPSRDRPPVA